LNRTNNIRLILIGLGFVVLQVVLLRHLQIFGAEPDLILVFLLWLCKSKSRTIVLLYAALLAFTQDALLDLWGIHLFSKTFMIFILHPTLNRISKNKFIFWQVLIIVFVSALIHNIAFFGVTLFSELYSSGGGQLALRLLLSSFYTAFLGAFLQLVKEDN
tara:strand:+ start:15105 stop:15584 length:480 start_codon:yes stop_codon:yes gene_type:complete